MRQKLHCGIDLHSNNSYVAVIDGDDRTVFQRRLRNDLGRILEALHPFREEILDVAVESTFNWYWLVDGLVDAGYDVKLVNTVAVQKYDGLKYTDDRHDAIWLAHLSRLGILPTGYIYPKESRGLRDLLRRRIRLVQQRTACILSVQSIQQREKGARFTTNQIKTEDPEILATTVCDPNVAMALRSTQAVIISLTEQIRQVEAHALKQLRPNEAWQRLNEIWGVGRILGSTILLEAGPIERFKSAGHFASYGRLVPSNWTSNGKSKGEGNRKNGNRYLCWAFIEAADQAIRHYPAANRWYHRKAQATRPALARKALAHKLARAAFYTLRDGAEFRPELLFGS